MRSSTVTRRHAETESGPGAPRPVWWTSLDWLTHELTTLVPVIALPVTACDCCDPHAPAHAASVQVDSTTRFRRPRRRHCCAGRIAEHLHHLVADDSQVTVTYVPDQPQPAPSPSLAVTA